MKKCERCGKSVEDSEIFIVDDENVCAGCLFENHPPFEIYPIGFVRNELRRDASAFGVNGNKEVSRLELFSSQKPFLYKLEDEEFITVIYYLHKTRPVRSVFERGWDGKKVGVFASRTPDRLSRIAIQDTRLLKIEGTNIFVQGLDAIDGSPILDIKMTWSNVAGI